VLGAIALLLGWVLDRERRPLDALGLAFLPALAVTFSATGHAATTSPDWFSIADDMLHVTAMGVWLGAIVMLVLAVLPRQEPDELTAVLPRVSAVALISVVMLAASGTYSAWRGVGTWSALFTTTYGVLVVIKASLLLCVVAVANFARRSVQQRWASGTERIRRGVLV